MRTPVRLSKERPNCTDRHFHGGHVARLEHELRHVFSTCLGVQRNIREQHRTFLGRGSILTEYLGNVGDTTSKTSISWNILRDDRIDLPLLTENLRIGGATALISSQMVPTQSTFWSCVRRFPGTKELL